MDLIGIIIIETGNVFQRGDIMFYNGVYCLCKAPINKTGDVNDKGSSTLRIKKIGTC